MLKIIKDSTLVPTPIVDLKLDSEPRLGSTDPVTSEGVKSAIDGAVGDASEALKEQIDEIAEKAGSGYTPKGPASVATLNGLSGQENGDLYTMTDAGTLTLGSLAVVAGDTVAWDEANSVWYKAMDYAPAQYGTNEVHNLSTTITAFRTGDVIPVDGPSGTAKMSKDLLLAIANEYVKEQNNSIEHLQIVSNDEYIFAIVDSESRFLFGIKNDGSVSWAKGVPVIDGKTFINKVFADAQSAQERSDYVKCLADEFGKLLEAVDKSGKRIFFNKVRFEQDVEFSENSASSLATFLKAYGVGGGQGDWSDKSELAIGEPRCAVINFSGIEHMPATKTADLDASIQFWDMNGNYFRKKCVLNAQGNSSLAFIKKNVSLDLLNDDDTAFKLKIGDWVVQDSFHLKAYYTDYFRGVGAVCYKFYKSILDTRPFMRNRSWKLATIDPDEVSIGFGLGYGQTSSDNKRSDYGALCFPMAFPCIVFLNGEFYGIFSFQLKKHRDNYNMKKSDAKNIHLDGTLDSSTIFGGTIDWTAFEIRNPKDLVLLDGTTKYDGDNPQEIIGSDSPNYDPSNSKHVLTASVKSKIVALSTSMASIISARDAYKSSPTEENLAIARSAYEAVFDKENGIDYQVFSDVIKNMDGFTKNWQWTTWDGVHWFVNAYDLDMSFGASFMGNQIEAPITSAHIKSYTDLPVAGFIPTLYNDELESRYAQLRAARVIDKDVIAGMVADWVKAIGSSAFENEWSKWPDSPCNNDTTFNTDYWTLDGEVTDTPKYSLYDGEHSYSADDTCSLALTHAMGYYNFICAEPCTGERPVLSWAIRDSIWRVAKWIETSIINNDSIYNYNGG